MTASSGGFELRGADGDETRLLVHVQLGYSIAIPGRPRIARTSSGSPSYDVALVMQDAPVELGFRMDESPAGPEPTALVASLLTAYAVNRAESTLRLSPSILHGGQLAMGAAVGLRANYTLRGDDTNAMEFLAVSVKQARSTASALHMTVRYRKGELSPFAWSNLRSALLAHQSWRPGTLPATPVWPASASFVPGSVKFQLTDSAFEVARTKAELIGDLAQSDVDRLADVLLDGANVELPPGAIFTRDLEGTIARAIVGCVPSPVAELLMRNLPEVQSIHDYRGWLWQCYWAVGNRAGLRKTN